MGSECMLAQVLFIFRLYDFFYLLSRFFKLFEHLFNMAIYRINPSTRGKRFDRSLTHLGIFQIFRTFPRVREYDNFGIIR